MTILCAFMTLKCEQKNWQDGARAGLEMEVKCTDKRRIICDTTDFYPIQRTGSIDVKKYRTTLMALPKDGKTA